MAVFTLAVLLTGCGDGVRLKPRSNGEACSVVVTGTDQRACAMVARMLEVEEPGLPQPENAFDVMIAGASEKVEICKGDSRRVYR